MPRQMVSINIDRLADALIDLKTPHYWDIKRRKVLAGEDGESSRTVLIDTLNTRKLRKLVTDFGKILDTADGKTVSEVAKTGLDKFPKLLEKSPKLQPMWSKFAGQELAKAAVAWLELQGIEKYMPTGNLARYISKRTGKIRHSEEE